MPDLTDIVANAMANAEDAGAGEADTPTEVAAETSEAAPVDSPEAAPAETATTDTAQAATDEDPGKDWIEFGLPPLIPGQREQRIPRSRNIKILTNAKKKWEAEQTKKLDTLNQQIEQAKTRLQYMDAVDQLIATDPARYLDLLAQQQPAVRQFLREHAAAQGQPAPAETDAMPEPDIRYSDGSTGYSDAQWRKRDEWLLRQAEERATAKIQQQVQPIVSAYQTQQQLQQHQRRALSDIQQIVEVWGPDLVKQHETDIAAAITQETQAALRERRMPAPAHITAAKILRERNAADRTKMRQELMDELNKRPAAASRAPGSSSGLAPSDEPQSDQSRLESVVASVFRRAR